LASAPAVDEGDTILITGEGRDDGFNLSGDEERLNSRLL
jgi:hypothetical protein